MSRTKTKGRTTAIPPMTRNNCTPVPLGSRSPRRRGAEAPSRRSPRPRGIELVVDPATGGAHRKRLSQDGHREEGPRRRRGIAEPLVVERELVDVDPDQARRTGRTTLGEDEDLREPWRAALMPSTMLKRTIGVISGNVIARKVAQVDAPSSSATS